MWCGVTEQLKILPNIMILLAMGWFVAEAVATARRVRRAREEDPSLVLVPVDEWPPEILGDHR
jgi:hypothetical protein